MVWIVGPQYSTSMTGYAFVDTAYIRFGPYSDIYNVILIKDKDWPMGECGRMKPGVNPIRGLDSWASVRAPVSGYVSVYWPI